MNNNQKGEKMNMNEMKDKTIMYIKMYKAINRMMDSNNLRNRSNEEELDLIQYIVNTIESNLDYYEIEKYNYHKSTATDALRYYIETLSKKYLDLENVWDTKYLRYDYYIPIDPKKAIQIEETIYKIKKESDVMRFLDWWKNVNDCCIVQYFNYRIINQNEISNIITNSECKEIRVEIQDFGYNFFNPIIVWENYADTPTLFIMDWINLRSSIIKEGWMQDSCDEDEFLEKFGTPTLEEYLEEHYGELHKEVRFALEHEINEFYNLYKDDIVIEDGELMVPCDGLWLNDAIWNHAPLFNNNTIGYIVEKLYKKEIKL